MPKQLLILVHGWSVTSTETYGELPLRLEAEALLNNAPEIDIHHIYLSKYVSFRDVVQLEDLSYGFEAALRAELGSLLDEGRRFACITHSTGGPIMRDWWQRFYIDRQLACPMSHLIMLAPANFGSGLAQLGKNRLSRIKSNFENVEPGEGILNWLELGSLESWALNKPWICHKQNPAQSAEPVFLFVLAGQTIDRHLYDHVNSYTGELGSDGVIRLASANLNASYIKLRQEQEHLVLEQHETAVETAFCVVPQASHSGDRKGIIRSIKKEPDEHPTVKLILECLGVNSAESYAACCAQFKQYTQVVQEQEKVEPIKRYSVPDGHYIHDRNSMVIFRMLDNRHYPVKDFSLVLTGENDDANALAKGFFIDRQANTDNPNMLTYYVNYDVMQGSPEINYENTRIRPALPGMNELGLKVTAQPMQGVVHYKTAKLKSLKEYLQRFIQPNQTTLIEIELTRQLEANIFSLTKEKKPENFKGIK